MYFADSLLRDLLWQDYCIISIDSARGVSHGQAILEPVEGLLHVFLSERYKITHNWVNIIWVILWVVLYVFQVQVQKKVMHQWTQPKRDSLPDIRPTSSTQTNSIPCRCMLYQFVLTMNFRCNSLSVSFLFSKRWSWRDPLRTDSVPISPQRRCHLIHSTRGCSCALCTH